MVKVFYCFIMYRTFLNCFLFGYSETLPAFLLVCQTNLITGEKHLKKSLFLKQRIARFYSKYCLQLMFNS
jgi:hypothetical protein